MTKLQKLQEHRRQLANRIQALASACPNGIPADKRGEWDTLNANYDAARVEVDQEIDRIQGQVAAALGVDPSLVGDGSHLIGDVDDDARSLLNSYGVNGYDGYAPPTLINGNGGNGGRLFVPRDEKRLDAALSAWCRNQSGFAINQQEAAACHAYGISPSSGTFRIPLNTHRPMLGSDKARILNAQSSISGTAGGYTVPTSFRAALEKAMLHFSGMMMAGEIFTTQSGEPLTWPQADDTGNEGALIGESQESTEQDVSFSAKQFYSYKLTSKLVRVPHELLRDSGLDLASELGMILGERLGRKANSLFTTGTGASQPTGIVTDATLGKTAASAVAFDLDEIYDLVYSIDRSYRDRALGCALMMNDTTINMMRKLKDGSSNYVWQAPSEGGATPTFDGWDVITNNSMADVAASAKPILFGAFKKFKIRLVGELRLIRLVERYAEFDQQGFLAFLSLDGGLLDAGTHPVKYLQMSA